MANVAPGGNNLINAKKVLERAGVTNNMKVGDFGCGGVGHFSLMAGELVGKEGIVYAVDILKTVLSGVKERAKTRGLDNIKTVWSNLEVFGATKIEDASLDIGFLINILFQTKKDAEIIKECARMIKVDGKILVIDWNKDPGFGPAVLDRVDVDEIRRIFKDLGFREMESFEAGKHHWAMVFVK